MILIKRGSCLLAVVILAFNLCLPLAYATEDEETTVTTRAALPALGWRDTVAAWLMASGIYPTMTEDDTSFGGWADDRVVSIWSEFVDYVGDSTQATLEDLYNISSYLVDGVMTISKGRWGQLRNFTQFLRDKYALQDNQEGVKIQLNQISGAKLPTLDDNATAVQVKEAGWKADRQGSAFWYYAHVGTADTYCFFYGNKTRPYRFFFSLSANQVELATYNGDGLVRESLSQTYTYGNYTLYANYHSIVNAGSYIDGETTGLFFENIMDGLEYYESKGVFDGATISDDSLIVDTTIVNTPAALPAESDYGGIRIAGTGEAVTVEALQELIQEAVIEGLQPIINVVGVDLAPDININPDNGDITQDPIEITPDNIPMTQSDYMIPQLHTRFPFSIPWDVFNVLNALNAEPQRPYWDVSLTLPGLFGEDVQIPFTIGVKDDSPVAAPMDRTAAVIRAFVFVLLCVGTLLAVIRR